IECDLHIINIGDDCIDTLDVLHSPKFISEDSEHLWVSFDIDNILHPTRDIVIMLFSEMCSNMDNSLRGNKGRDFLKRYQHISSHNETEVVGFEPTGAASSHTARFQSECHNPLDHTSKDAG